MVPRGTQQRFLTVNIGKPREWTADIYVKSLSIPWKRLCLLIVLFYIFANLVFATVYMMLGNGINNARPGSFADAFFFSVQTLATIGYGNMSPRGFAANCLVMLEALTGFGFFAVTTGLIFSKFSRPTSRLLFSEIAVVTPHNGVPHLMFRLANKRGNRIVDANIQVAVLLEETTLEGTTLRRFHDLKLVRSRIPLLMLTWTVMHPIDEHSPIYAMDLKTLQDRDAEIVVSLSGLDETLSQTVHARFSYIADDIHFGAPFADIMRRTEDNKMEINYRLFHQTRTHPPSA